MTCLLQQRPPVFINRDLRNQLSRPAPQQKYLLLYSYTFFNKGQRINANQNYKNWITWKKEYPSPYKPACKCIYLHTHFRSSVHNTLLRCLRSSPRSLGYLPGLVTLWDCTWAQLLQAVKSCIVKKYRHHENHKGQHGEEKVFPPNYYITFSGNDGCLCKPFMFLPLIDGSTKYVQSGCGSRTKAIKSWRSLQFVPRSSGMCVPNSARQFKSKPQDISLNQVIKNMTV